MSVLTDVLERCSALNVITPERTLLFHGLTYPGWTFLCTVDISRICVRLRCARCFYLSSLYSTKYFRCSVREIPVIPVMSRTFRGKKACTKPIVDCSYRLQRQPMGKTLIVKTALRNELIRQSMCRLTSWVSFERNAESESSARVRQSFRRSRSRWHGEVGHFQAAFPITCRAYFLH